MLASVILPVAGPPERVAGFLRRLATATPSACFELVWVDVDVDADTSELLGCLGGDVVSARLPPGTPLLEAVNVGAGLATGTHLVVCDPACVLRPGWIEPLLGVLEIYAQVGAVGPALAALGASPEPRPDDTRRPLSTEQPVDELPWGVFALRRAAFEQVSGFALTGSTRQGSSDLFRRMRDAGWEVLLERRSQVEMLPPWQPAPTTGCTPSPASRPGEPGINVIGFFEAELGIGESARLLVDGIEAAGWPVATSSYYRHHNRATHPYRHRRRAEQRWPYPTNVFCINGDILPAYAAERPDVLAGRRNVAMWHWELEELPDRFAEALDTVDEVWAGSSFAREAIAARTTKPVHTVVLPIPVRSGRPTHTRAEVGLPDGFVFGYTLDANSILARKNPDGVIRAFCRAFRPGEGPQLVVKTINSTAGAGRRTLAAMVAGRPDVTLVEGYLPPELSTSWTGLVDCYVSLHRSEGFGLTLAEAMSWAVPVIATGYSGNLDFMSPDNSYLVRWAPGRVPVGAEPYPAGARWAEPDLDDAAAAMRAVWEHPAEARRLGLAGQESIRSTHGLDAAAAVLTEILEGPRGLPPHLRPAGPRAQSVPQSAVLTTPGRRDVKLNVGAGDQRKDGFFSLDVRPDTSDVVASADRLPIADARVDEILASDLLEHFPASRTQSVLAEWRRVLRPGGLLTVRVPNLLALACLLVEHPETRPDVIRNIYGGHRWGPQGAWDTHHTGWTPDLLHDELRAAGFAVVSDDGATNNTVRAVKAPAPAACR